MSSWVALAVAIVGVAVLERWWPARPESAIRVRRIAANVGCYAVNRVLAGVLAPVIGALVGQAWTASVGAGAGLLGALPVGPLHWLAAFLAHDLVRYITHRLMHSRWLWRFHALHHSDAEPDWSTAVRHHPLETIVSMPIYAVAFGVLGIDPATAAVLATINGCWDLFVHANVTLPRPVQRALGAVAVTPALHAVHHSASREEADSNYGGILMVWDRLLGTARAAEPAPRRYGLEHRVASADANVAAMLLLPFRSAASPEPSAAHPLHSRT